MISTQEEENAGSLPSTSRPTLTILVNDISESAEHVHISIASLRQLLHFDAVNGGTQLATLLINGIGDKQMPWISSLHQADTTVLSRTMNIYRRTKIAQKNRGCMILLDSVLNTWADTLKTKVLLPKTDGYSDANGTFYLLTHLAQAYQAKNYRLRVLIFSDLIQDMPNNTLLRPIKLPPNAEIFLIGASPKVDLQRVFPNNKVTLIPVFDAQLFIQKNH
jgi:hypothetical protein